MMGIETIQAIAREAAERSARETSTPYVYWDEYEVGATQGFPFPFLGDYEPPGWEEVNSHFVDSSGMGAPGEAALTVDQFLDVIREAIAVEPVTGWAVTQAGQFQVYVGEFRRVAKGAS